MKLMKAIPTNDQRIHPTYNHIWTRSRKEEQILNNLKETHIFNHQAKEQRTMGLHYEL